MPKNALKSQGSRKTSVLGDYLGSRAECTWRIYCFHLLFFITLQWKGKSTRKAPNWLRVAYECRIWQSCLILGSVLGKKFSSCKWHFVFWIKEGNFSKRKTVMVSVLDAPRPGLVRCWAAPTCTRGLNEPVLVSVFSCSDLTVWPHQRTHDKVSPPETLRSVPCRNQWCILSLNGTEKPIRTKLTTLLIA